MSTQNGIPGPLSRLQGLMALGLCLCLLLALCPAPAQAAAAGSWTDSGNYDEVWWNNGSDNEYYIASARELAGVACISQRGGTFEGKTLILGADIDLAAHIWPGIDNFKGTFDGNGHTISNMTQSITAAAAGSWGFFNKLDGATVSSLRLYAPNIYLRINVSADIKFGVLAGDSVGSSTIKDCIVENAQVETEFYSGSDANFYAGGLVGGNTGTNAVTVTNSGVLGLAARFQYSVNTGHSLWWSGLGQGTYQNCFVSTGSVDLTSDNQSKFFYLGETSKTSASYCYWLPNATLTQDPAAVAGTECFSVTTDQILTDDSTLIGSSESAYAATGSVVKALNNWVRRNGGTQSTWTTRTGSLNLNIFLPPPDYIDIGAPGTDVRHEDINAVDTPLTLEGQAYKGVTLLSVTLPIDVPFIMEADGAGKLVRLLSATGTITNRSDCAVDVTLDSVVDGAGLLGKVDLFLVPDPPPASARVALTPGTGLTGLLASLAAPGAGDAVSAKLRVEGQAKADGTPLGADGEEYLVALVLKVTKSP